MGSPAEVVAAGAVVWRKGPAGVDGRRPREVLLVHRPKYDDWSFPKGKLDPGEHVLAAAVREVAEETGLDVRLGPRLATQRYHLDDGAPKDVHYWVGHLLGGDDVDGYRPNDEIDQVAWVPLAKTADRLTYPHDRATLEEFRAVRKRSWPLVVVRHCRALPRGSWGGDDRDRTLTTAGRFQAEQLVPLLAAYGISRLVASSSRRCWSTLAPYADCADVDLEVTDDLSEEGARGPAVAEHVARLLAAEEPTALCTHRPVLPQVFEALALEQRRLEPGGLLVVHHRRGEVLGVEQHETTFR